MNIERLSKNIIEIHQQLQQKAVSAVNISLTLRNWFIGYYIVEYEQKGEDRAKYGDKLIKMLSEKLKKGRVRGMSYTNLNLFRQFYLVYPQIIRAVPEQLTPKKSQPLAGQLEAIILQPLAEELQGSVNQNIDKNTSQKNNPKAYLIPPEKTITKLSFTHMWKQN